MTADQLDLFTPQARMSDIDTAHQAAVIAINRSAKTRRAVLEALYDAGPGGLTDFQTADLIGSIQTSCGCRRNELVKQGLVVRAFVLDPVTLDRVPLNGVSPMGSPASRWEITPAGVDVVESWRAERGAA